MTDKTVLDALKNACERAGSQLELAKQTGLSQGQISDYLCGRRKIKNMTLGTFAKIFPDLEMTFFPDEPPGAAAPVEYEIKRLVRALSAVEKAKCLKILAAHFSEKITAEYSNSELDHRPERPH